MIAKNNIFNIRAMKGQTWMGQTGERRGFAEFIDKTYAIRAWLVIMRTYQRKHHCTTLAEIVTRYAPPKENNTAAYIRYCETVVRSEGRALTPRQYLLLGQAMAWYETTTKLSTQEIDDIQNAFLIDINN